MTHPAATRVHRIGRGAISTLFACLVLLAAISGCGRSTAARRRTELRYCFFGGFEDWKMWRQCVAEFEQANPDIHVSLLYWPGANYEAKLQLTMAAGTAPDVICVQDEPFAAYTKMGQFEDLGPYVQSAGDEYAPDRFYQTSLETFRVGGRQYGLPWNGGMLMIYYNRALFRKAGLPDPPPRDWTWEQWVEYSRKLTRDEDGDGRIDQFGTQVNPHYMGSLLPWIWMFGGDTLDDSMTHATLDTPQSRQTLTFLRDLIYKEHVAPRSNEFTGMGGSVMFMTGRVAMVMDGVWALQFMRQTDIDWDVTFLPRGPAGRYSRGTWDGVSMYRKSVHKPEAWRFIRFITGERGQYYVAHTGRAIPPRKSQANTPEFIRPDTPQHEERFLEAMQDFRTQKMPEQWAEMDVVLKREMEKLYSPKGDPATQAKTLQRDINAILARP